jgi:hypothetical protein
VITKNEIEMTQILLGEAQRTYVDIYLAYLDGSPVEEGADIDAVVSEVWQMNRNLRRGIDYRTLIYVENQWELLRLVVHRKIQRAASDGEWVTLAAGLKSLLIGGYKLIRMWLRIRSSVRPAITAAELHEIRSLHAQ